MSKSSIKFVLEFAVIQFLTYFFAGIIARDFLGAKIFYPPSADALNYLRDPMTSHVMKLLIPSQLSRGLLLGIVLLPFRKRLHEFTQLKGGLIISAIVLVFGYIAASGGLIEHYVYFTSESYPLKFALITLVEIIIQTTLLGQLFIFFEKKFNNKDFNQMISNPKIS